MSKHHRRVLGWGAAAVAVGALALVAAGCGSSSKSSSGGTTTNGLEPADLDRQGRRGAQPDRVAGYYSDPTFAKTFESQTGCKIHRKDAGSSNEMVALMRGGGGGGGRPVGSRLGLRRREPAADHAAATCSR